MKKITILSTAILMAFCSSIYPQSASIDKYKGNWDFETSESKLTFKIGNMFIFNVKGEMPIINGFFKNGDHPKIKALINVSLIETGINKRDNHLKSEDFFYTEKYPQIEFSSNQVSKNSIDNGYEYQAKGKLKIRGIEKEETVFFNIESLSNSEISIIGEAKINRLDYEVDHQMAGMDDVATVKFEVKGILQKE